MKFYLKVIVLLIGINVSGQSLLHTNGRAIVNANGDSVILKTMNLGGWMLIEPYQLQAAGVASAQWELKK
jgi:hypothetical protein